MLFINAGQIENKLEAKLKKQEIVFDTAVFHFELLFDNKVTSSLRIWQIKKNEAFISAKPISLSGLHGARRRPGGQKGVFDAHSSRNLL